MFGGEQGFLKSVESIGVWCLIVFDGSFGGKETVDILRGRSIPVFILDRLC